MARRISLTVEDDDKEIGIEHLVMDESRLALLKPAVAMMPNDFIECSLCTTRYHCDDDKLLCQRSHCPGRPGQEFKDLFTDCNMAIKCGECDTMFQYRGPRTLLTQNATMNGWSILEGTVEIEHALCPFHKEAAAGNGSLDFHCELCTQVILYEGKNMHAAIRKAKRLGWHVVTRHGKYKVVRCPDHRNDETPSYPKKGKK